MKAIRLRDFSETPGPRYRHEGPYSGEEWRDDTLLPAFNEAVGNSTVLEVDLDDVEGFASSFLEEAFGGLVRASKMPHEAVAKHLAITCTDEPDIVDHIINRYLPNAGQVKPRSALTL